MSDGQRSRLFTPIIYLGGLVFGVGLAISGMARPEVVLDFLQFDDFGLAFVMGGAAVVTGTTIALATRSDGHALVTGSAFTRRMKDFDSNVIFGGTIFGVGWGISGICPGAAYASIGIGNYPILWALAGMFVGAYAQGYWRTRQATGDDDGIGASSGS
ncbi:MAG: putative transporter component [Halorubrum sp. J07HR59]|nr:MAG: putative transporter component [Halorubrum sp. J07HR59]